MLVADFLLERLEQLGLRHAFGVPGDYIISFFERLAKSSKIKLVNNTDENHAGFAADAYARAAGIGVVCTTYNVGTLKLCNAVAGAFAERSPLIVISGSPGLKERGEDYVLHHVVKSYDCQKDIFSNITCASVILDDPQTAAYRIDYALEMLKHKKQPIYIELPRDIAERPIKYDFNSQGTPSAPANDDHNMSEAIQEIVPWLGQAKQPVILAGVQLARYGLEKPLIKFVEKTNIPVATTMLSKSTVNEQHPLFLGTYAGNAGTEFVKKYVEESDCLLLFGEVLSDMTCGFKPIKFNRRKTVTASVEGLTVKNHAYKDVNFRMFCESLFKSDVAKRNTPGLPEKVVPGEWNPVDGKRISTIRFFEKVNSILDGKTAIVADPGDSLFGAVDIMSVHQTNTFYGPAFYNSMGFAIPGALGVQLACNKLRPIVLVGDGAFQMSCSELSTIARLKLNPIVFVLNNRGYTTERFIKDGPFNDIQDWNYEKMADVINSCVGVKVSTEEELERAVSAALASKQLYLINVLVEPKDISPALRRMTAGLADCIS
jgi:indolepyruvate decarboxylase